MPNPDLLLVASLPPHDVEALTREFTVHRFDQAADKGKLLAEVGQRIRAIATSGGVGAKAELIGALPKLEIISCYGVGVDAIDLPAARARGVKVTNTPDVLTDDVADLAVALTLATVRQIPASDRYVREGRWPAGAMALTAKLSGRRAGIIGLGRIGLAIAKRLSAFDMPIRYYNRSVRSDVPYGRATSIEALAEDSDVLIAALPGGPESDKAIGAKVFAALGKDGYFINIARGSVVDEPALLAALEARTIKGAGLDVFWGEPNIDPRFLKLDNVVLLPHVGSATVETRRAMGELMRANLTAHFAGLPLLTPVA